MQHFLRICRFQAREAFADAFRRVEVAFLQQDAREGDERLAALVVLAGLFVGDAEELERLAVVGHDEQHLLEIGDALGQLGADVGSCF